MSFGGSRGSPPRGNEESPVRGLCPFSPALSRSCDGVGTAGNSVRTLAACSPIPRRGPGLSMTTFFSKRPWALVAGATAMGLVLAAQPAQAHGSAQGGFPSGLLHPLQGLDHLLLLVGVGMAAAAITPRLLLWALGGAVAGGVFGAFGGSLPGQELLAALAVSAMGLLVLVALQSKAAPRVGWCGALVAGGLAIHAMLHGLEAPTTAASALWWSGAALASVSAVGASYLLFQRMSVGWLKAMAVVFAALGGGLALGFVGAA